MQIRKVIQRRIRRTSEGVDFAGDVNAAISANVGEHSSTSHVSSRSTVSARSNRRDTEEERRAAAALNVVSDDSTAVPGDENTEDASEGRGRREETE
jgi:hypothetical protein